MWNRNFSADYFVLHVNFCHKLKKQLKLKTFCQATTKPACLTYFFFVSTKTGLCMHRASAYESDELSYIHMYFICWFPFNTFMKFVVVEKGLALINSKKFFWYSLNLLIFCLVFAVLQIYMWETFNKQKACDISLKINFFVIIFNYV